MNMQDDPARGVNWLTQRITRYNGIDVNADGLYVLYWMQQSQREHYNHALEYAVSRGNELRLPVLVAFGVTDGFPEANRRHYAFMFQGLQAVRQALHERGITFVVCQIDPVDMICELAGRAAMVVMDCGYLRIQRQWRESVARRLDCPVVEVESDVVVPVITASSKEEFAARTIRPKIHRCLQQFMQPLRRTPVRVDPIESPCKTLDVSDTSAAIDGLHIDHSVPEVTDYTGGTDQACRLLDTFISERLAEYDTRRNEPADDWVSHMSPYLHFGQISPLYVALQVERSDAPRKAKDAYLEELIVRRELSMNFVYYNRRYDRYDGLPDWARKTLAAHATDARPYRYTPSQWEQAQTHDPYWNAAQRQMVLTGKMHNYMRMYWGKKLLEWSATPQEAFRTALYLNNKYELDGRDANSFTGVAWCFGKHDRPWTERDIFGTVRYMNAAGLRRKFDMDAYVTAVDALDA